MPRETKQRETVAQSLMPLGVGFMMFFLNGGWIVVTLLKETPSFWTNAGGYPLFLRDAMQLYYYPTLYLIVVVQIGLTAFFAYALKQQQSMLGILGLLSLGPSWLLLLICGAILTANNFSNLLSDRPLHWHPGDTRQTTPQ